MSRSTGGRSYAVSSNVWSLADMLFPPECKVLYHVEGYIYYYYNDDGMKEVVITTELSNELLRRIEEED